MSFTKAPIAYEDIRPVLDRALDAEKGIRLSFERRSEAVRWVTRANHFRTYHRSQSRIMFPDANDPRHHQCIYDKLVIRRPFDAPEGSKIIVEVLNGYQLAATVEEL